MTETAHVTDYTVVLSAGEETERRDFLHRMIRQFNTDVSPAHRQARQPGAVRPLGVYLETPAGEIVGGLISDTYWDWWEIDYFWIREELRGQGYGSRILHMAEEEARRRGCQHAQLRTFSFQAPDFYRRLGFRVIGQLDDYPPGATFYWMRKELD